MKRKANALDSLSNFINEYGVPEWIILDGAPEGAHGQKTAWKQIEQLCHIWHIFTEPHSPWQNACEGGIREMKKGMKRMISDKNHCEDSCAMQGTYWSSRGAW
eukprot:7217693-Ditylum_brightwellii.AAC.1